MNTDEFLTNRIPLIGLTAEPYVSILCYPRSDHAEAKKRITELRALHVSVLEFVGNKPIGNVCVLGKGNVGIVVAAYLANRKVALKIRRMDADRTSMEHEATMLLKANLAGVGPRFISASKNFLLMQFVQGRHLPDWLESADSQERVKSVFGEILRQCRRLDVSGLDHGELSRAPKHVLITENDVPFMVDFETSSLRRRPSNVTSMFQYLFGYKTSPPFALDKRQVIWALKRYKKRRSSYNFDKILDVSGLGDVV